jgi:hypothetical protein
MIEFHAGTGPDTQAIGIALEEMFLDYRVMPGKAPLPVIAIGGARLVGASNVLKALARKTGRFLPSGEAAPWLSNTPLDLATLEAKLSSAEFILGAVSIADMAVYPRLAFDSSVLAAHPSIARWASRMAKRSALGRGMSVIAG